MNDESALILTVMCLCLVIGIMPMACKIYAQKAQKLRKQMNVLKAYDDFGGKEAFIANHRGRMVVQVQSLFVGMYPTMHQDIVDYILLDEMSPALQIELYQDPTLRTKLESMIETLPTILWVISTLPAVVSSLPTSREVTELQEK